MEIEAGKSQGTTKVGQLLINWQRLDWRRLGWAPSEKRGGGEGGVRCGSRIWRNARKGDFVCDDRNRNMTLRLVLCRCGEVERWGCQEANRKGAIDGDNEERRKKGGDSCVVLFADKSKKVGFFAVIMDGLDVVA